MKQDSSLRRARRVSTKNGKIDVSGRDGPGLSTNCSEEKRLPVLLFAESACMSSFSRYVPEKGKGKTCLWSMLYVQRYVHARFSSYRMASLLEP